MKLVKKTFQYGDHTVTIETGEIARQAGGAVTVTMSDSVVLVATTARKEVQEGRGFFPLTVHYIEKTYAAGKIPGGFFKREGRPSEKETLTSRLIDRPIRPLFPKGFMNEVQVMATVISVNPDVNPDIPAILGASAALALSGIPFEGPIAAARVGYSNGQYILNPTADQLLGSSLDLVVAGTARAVLMVESEAKILPESVMLGAVTFGHREMQTAIGAIGELVAEAGKPKWDWQAQEPDTELESAVDAQARTGLTEAYQISDKQERYRHLGEVKDGVISALVDGDDAGRTTELVGNQLHALEKNIVRSRILDGEPRIDGRDTTTVRPISVRVGLLPRTHGSALFTRGETQAIVVTTLGTGRDAQIVDALEGERKDQFPRVSDQRPLDHFW